MTKEYEVGTVKLLPRDEAIGFVQAFYKETCIPSILLYENMHENISMFLGIPSELAFQALILFKHGEWSAALELIQEKFGLGLVALGSNIIDLNEFKVLMDDHNCCGYWVNVMIVRVIPTSVKIDKTMIAKIVEGYLSNNRK